MPTGRTIADGYVELRTDDSKLKPEVQAKARQITNTFGNALNKELARLSIKPLDMKANPRDALAAIDRTEKELRELSRTAATLELRMDANKALGSIGRFKKSFGDLGPEAAEGFVAKLGTRIGPLMANLPLSPHMAVAIGAGAAAAAPVLAATLAGAVTLGVGAGVVAAGLKIAASDPQVQEAGKIAGEEFKEGFRDVASPFKEELLDAIGVARAQFRSLRPELTGLFADAAPYVPILVAALADIAHELLPDIATATRNARPLIEFLGREGPEAAAVLGRALVMMSSVADESAMVLTSLIKIIELLTLTTGGSLTVLAKIAPIVQGPLVTLAGFLPDIGDGARDAAEGTDELSAELKANAAEAVKNAAAVEKTKLANEALTVAQQALSRAQEDLKSTISGLAPGLGRNATLVDNLRQAADNLYGATIRNTDANKTYEASWDDLSDSVKSNGKSLDVHSRAGRANHDVLARLLTDNGNLYLANIDAGQSIDSARKKHEARTEAVRKESARLGLNSKETERLIDTYGRIPPKRTTDLILSGMKAIADQLSNLYLAQRALAEGKTVQQLRGGMQGNARLFKAEGGPITGLGTGVSDSVPVAASVGEHMWTAREVNMAGGHQAVKAIRDMALSGVLRRAEGGPIARVETRQRIPVTVNVSGTKIPSRAEVLAAVTPKFSGRTGDWPSSPAAQRGDSGVWRSIVRFIKATGPISGSFGNAYRHGDPKWHGSGRAVDWMGYNQDALASRLAALRPLELIHRGARDWAYTRGRNIGSFNQQLMNQHRNHIHVAMDKGGHLMPGWNPPIYNGTGRPETVTTGPDMDAVIAVLQRILERLGYVGADVGAELRGVGRQQVQLARARGAR